VARKTPNRSENLLGSVEDFRLHPLIHTLVEITLAQDIESIRSGTEAPHGSFRNE